MGYWTNPPGCGRIVMARSLFVVHVLGWAPTMSVPTAGLRSFSTQTSVLKELRVPNRPREGHGARGTTPGLRIEVRQSQRALGVCGGRDPVLGTTQFLRGTSPGATSPRVTNHLRKMERAGRRSIGMTCEERERREMRKGSGGPDAFPHARS